jgi:hypothetical protein
MAEPVRSQATVEDLERWEEYGATWRMVELGDEQVVVELCTCYGEPVDMVASRDPSVIEFVRRHRDDQRS